MMGGFCCSLNACLQKIKSLSKPWNMEIVPYVEGSIFTDVPKESEKRRSSGFIRWTLNIVICEFVRDRVGTGREQETR